MSQQTGQRRYSVLSSVKTVIRAGTGIDRLVARMRGMNAASPDGKPTMVTNVPSRAAKGSPIAAVAYDFKNGAFHRQVSFYDTDGFISTTYATNEGARDGA